MRAGRGLVAPPECEEFTVPGGTVPGAAVPGRAVPGAAVPRSTVPRAAVPRSTVPRRTVPGRAGPCGRIPSQALGRDFTDDQVLRSVAGAVHLHVQSTPARLQR